jgi:DNA-binding NarL/FixJ family response regulator
VQPPNEPPPISTRVLVAEDHPLYREGLVAAIRAHQGLELVGEASGGKEALQLISALSPDLALLDVRMKVDGLAILNRLQALCSGTRVVFLSAYIDRALIYSALEAGAVGFSPSTPIATRSATRFWRQTVVTSSSRPRPRQLSDRRSASTERRTGAPSRSERARSWRSQPRVSLPRVSGSVYT